MTFFTGGGKRLFDWMNLIGGIDARFGWASLYSVEIAGFGGTG